MLGKFHHLLTSSMLLIENSEREASVCVCHETMGIVLRFPFF